MLETQWKKSYVCVDFIVVFVRLICFHGTAWKYSHFSAVRGKSESISY